MGEHKLPHLLTYLLGTSSARMPVQSHNTITYTTGTGQAVSTRTLETSGYIKPHIHFWSVRRIRWEPTHLMAKSACIKKVS